MNCKLLPLLAFFMAAGCAAGQAKTSPLSAAGADSSGRPDGILASILAPHANQFDSLFRHNNQWKIQILYTQINRDRDNRPIFTSHAFNLDTASYFYPASTVKMPTAVLALQRLNELNVRGLDRNTTMITEAGYPGLTAAVNDPSTPDGRPTIANYIRKIFLVSDNDAYNRLYEFLGQEYINATLHRMGFRSAQILHRLEVSLTEDQNRHSNPIRFFDRYSREIYALPLRKSSLVYEQRNTRLGNGYWKGNTVVNEPFDFSKKNRLSLPDLHEMLTSIIFPEAVPAGRRFGLKAGDYEFLYKYMSMKPAESLYPSYDSTYNDSYVKFLLYGGSESMEGDSIRIFNKPGDAYGFLTDVAYVIDPSNGVEFLLSATIACNSDGIFNDSRYDYETVGFPFLKNLGRAVYEYEVARKKKRQPDLSKFKIIYTPNGE